MNYISKRKDNKSYKIFDTIASSYSTINFLLSMGIDKRWRKKLLKKANQASKALDIACGTGDLSILLAKSSKVTHVTAIDMSVKMLDVANKRSAPNLKFLVGDGQNLAFESGSFDLATIAFGIRNFGDVNRSLSEIYRTLTVGGRLLILEFSIPRNMFIRRLYLFYFRNILPIIGGLLARNLKAYRYLNSTVESFPHGEDFLEMIRSAGFKECKATPLTFGIATIYKGDKLEA